MPTGNVKRTRKLAVVETVLEGPKSMVRGTAIAPTDISPMTVGSGRSASKPDLILYDRPRSSNWGWRAGE